MAGTGLAHARAGRRHNVNPFALVAIAGKESSYGLHRCGGRFNSWGITSCGGWSYTNCVNGPPYYPRFDPSWDVAINSAARFLRCRWPDATSVYELHGYCSGCSTWMGGVDSLMPGSGLRWRDALGG